MTSEHSFSRLTFSRNSSGLIVGQTLTHFVQDMQDPTRFIPVPTLQPTELPLPNYNLLFPEQSPPSFLSSQSAPFHYTLTHSLRRRALFQVKLNQVCYIFCLSDVPYFVEYSEHFLSS